MAEQSSHPSGLPVAHTASPSECSIMPDRCASFTRPVPVMLGDMSAADESNIGLDLRSDMAELTGVSPCGGDIPCCHLGGVANAL